MVLPCENYVNREDFVARYLYRLWLRNEFRVTEWLVSQGRLKVRTRKTAIWSRVTGESGQ